jgi:hypothetical protein
MNCFRNWQKIPHIYLALLKVVPIDTLSNTYQLQHLIVFCSVNEIPNFSNVLIILDQPHLNFFFWDFGAE